MTKDELRKRFPGAESDTSDEDNAHNTGNTENMNTTPDTSNAGGTDDASSTPGPTKDPRSTRNRKQVPMYLPEEKVSELNGLYEQLDGRSKVAGDGGIEKHADFMEELVELAVDHEDQLAERLGIE